MINAQILYDEFYFILHQHGKLTDDDMKEAEKIIKELDLIDSPTADKMQEELCQRIKMRLH